jgi:hypothetical protein
MSPKKKLIFIAATITLLLFAFVAYQYLPLKLSQNFKNKHTKVENTILPLNTFSKIDTNITFAPDSLLIIFYKKEQRVDLWILKDAQRQLLKTDTAFLDFSQNGMMLYNTDLRLPEGIYTAKRLLSQDFWTLDFPNDFDRRKQLADNRPVLQRKFTIGATENDFGVTPDFLKLWLLLANTLSSTQCTVIIAPHDFRNAAFAPTCHNCPIWTAELYAQIRATLVDFE